ncbi:helix-turn-helix domain-containing protein [Agrobacterium pusense]|uniref:helix-turn-helix domain-containing protein n=1 Tax=Agrobacterium pusense TaxID=648995 RepID=UPI00345E5DD0
MARATEVHTTENFSIADLNTDIDNEPRILDVRIGEELGFARPRKVREIIERNIPELLTYGSLPRRRANLGAKGGRPTEEAFLNEPQALLICMWSNTAKAASVRKMLIDVFMEYRRGKIEKPIHVREHDRRTSTKLDDALKLKTNIDRLESVVASIQPAVQPNFCAMVIDGEHVFVDINRFDGHGRAVVIQHDGKMRIQNVEPDAHNLRTFGARSALGERYKSPHGGVMRNSVAIVGMVIEPHIDEKRQGYVNDVTDKLREQIITLLEAGPFTDIQIANRLCCNPKFVNEVRKVQSRKPADMLPMRVIDHDPQYRGRRTIFKDEILRLIDEGVSNRDIAKHTGATYQTVTHWRRWSEDRATHV